MAIQYVKQGIFNAINLFNENIKYGIVLHLGMIECTLIHRNIRW